MSCCEVEAATFFLSGASIKFSATINPEAELEFYWLQKGGEIQPCAAVLIHTNETLRIDIRELRSSVRYLFQFVFITNVARLATQGPLLLRKDFELQADF